MKLGKAPGNDQSITPEALKFGKSSLPILQCICNKVLHTYKPPTQWLIDIIIPVPKKGNHLKMQNYRGISLMSISAKVYNRMILNRIYTSINTILRPNQAGFRRNMSGVEQINSLRRIIEGAKDKQLPIISTFIDFTKAFDSINRDTMWKILRHYSIPEKIVSAIKYIYDDSKSKVKIGNKVSEEFTVSTGVLQGDTLAPFLFVIV